jgi:hypothetical protein
MEDTKVADAVNPEKKEEPQSQPVLIKKTRKPRKDKAK